MPKATNRFIDEQTSNLIALGFVRGIDVVFVVGLITAIITIFFWGVFGSPQALPVLNVLVAMAIWVLVWVVILVFRCMWFVIQVMAEIKLMPANAARLSIAFMRKHEADAIAHSDMK